MITTIVRLRMRSNIEGDQTLTLGTFNLVVSKTIKVTNVSVGTGVKFNLVGALGIEPRTLSSTGLQPAEAHHTARHTRSNEDVLRYQRVTKRVSNKALQCLAYALPTPAYRLQSLFPLSTICGELTVTITTQHA